MIPTLGRLCLVLACLAAVYNVGATAWAYRVPAPRREAWLLSAFNSALALWGLQTLAFVLLFYLFLTNDFSVDYVAAHSALGQATIYKVSAAWGGQQGSLLMWSWILSTYGLIVAVVTRRSKLDLGPTTTAVICGVAIFFTGLVAFVASPFAIIKGGIAPPDGLGLNPLLQNYWMQIHPPTLYTGYVGCTIPFAFAVSAMLHRRFDKEWVVTVRRWTLIPWLILTIGIIMGGAWAYETLGWGGYWAWDPVENASLLPWLTGTAFLHSIIIQQRRGTLKNWNAVLVTLTFLLSIFGTFLTRSGIISSVHAFAQSNIGPYFLGFLALAMVLSFALIVWRRDDLRVDLDLESPMSREGAFLLNNWILLGSAACVLWGTVFPSVSEAVTGQTVTVGEPYFNRIMTPLGLALLCLTGVGPLMAWRRTSALALLRTFRLPIAIAIVAAPWLAYLSNYVTGAATSFCLAVFVVVAIGSEFVRGARARHAMTGEPLPVGFFNLFVKNRQRYGGYLVHLGIVMMAVGITGSSAFKIEKEPIVLKPGEQLVIGEYELRFDGLRRPRVLDKDKVQQVAASLTVLRNGVVVTQRRDGRLEDYQLFPSIDFFKNGPSVPVDTPPQEARRPAIMSSLSNDLYTVLVDFDQDSGSATIKTFLNPLIKWIWISTLFFVTGTLIAMWPDRRRRSALPVAETLQNEVQPALRGRAGLTQPVAASAMPERH